MVEVELTIEEVDRVIQLGRPLSVLVVVRRDMPIGMSPELMQQAWVAIANATRVDDRVGLIGNRALVAVLPETDGEGARVTADRLRTELSHRTNGNHVWSVLELPHAEQYRTGDHVVEAVLGVVA